MSKFKEILNSNNAWVTSISIVMMAIVANGIEVGMTPEEAFALFSGKTLIPILIAVVANFFNVFYKLATKIKNGTWSWSFLKSSNFWTQLVTLAMPFIIPFLGEDKAAAMGVVLANIINFMFHATAPAK